MALVLSDIDYQRDSFPADLLMAVGQPSFQQAYSGLVPLERRGHPQCRPWSTWEMSGSVPI
eukprot:7917751-Lingulodinium_polyedra.AAC.1